MKRSPQIFNPHSKYFLTVFTDLFFKERMNKGH